MFLAIIILCKNIALNLIFFDITNMNESLILFFRPNFNLMFYKIVLVKKRILRYLNSNLPHHVLLQKQDRWWNGQFTSNNNTFFYFPCSNTVMMMVRRYQRMNYSQPSMLVTFVLSLLDMKIQFVWELNFMGVQSVRHSVSSFLLVFWKN